MGPSDLPVNNYYAYERSQKHGNAVPSSKSTESRKKAFPIGSMASLFSKRGINQMKKNFWPGSVLYLLKFGPSSVTRVLKNEIDSDTTIHSH